VFNAWYYSFSPYIANYEKANPWFQQTVKVSIYPLLWILQLSEKAYWYMDGEYGSVAAGLLASSLIGSIYFSPFMLLSRRIRKTELDKKVIVGIMISVISAVFVSLLYRNDVALMITTSILVLATITVSSIFTARSIIYIGKLIQRTKSQFLSTH
jgi:peptide/nickel transport system substrate-binding protein